MNYFSRLRRAYRLYSFALTDGRTPMLGKILTGFALVYLISPIDLIPDAIPVLGELDDLIVILLVILHFLRAIPTEVKADEAKRERIKVDATY